jgi:hypothetical protein
VAEFHVIIEGLELDAQTTRSINDDIQKVVMNHLADQDLTVAGKHRGVVAYRPHPEWRGLVAQVVAAGDLRKIAGVEQTMERLG